MKKLMLSIVVLVMICFNTYSQQKIKVAASVSQMKNSNSVVVVGRVVPSQHTSTFIQGKNNELIAIVTGCICVQMPCDYCKKRDDHFPIILVLKRSDLIKTTKTNSKNLSGQTLTAYHFKKNAIIPSDILAFTGGNKLSKIKVNTPSGPKNIGGSAKVALLIEDLITIFKEAFDLGTEIDEEVGISDWIADTLCGWFNCNGMSGSKTVSKK